ncbi:MAG: hypothetical protein IKP36_02430 [Bacteroidaceae bacterium]|nr:hypothetical protein [Bacteroidaceae bacterium]
MKKFILSSVMMMAAWMGANAMSFSRAQAEALYLTDKMAYELNLNDQQYNDAYEINLDYFLNVDSPSDLYGSYYDYRVNDFRCILHDWQYSILLATDYFLRPLVWRAGGWFFPIYSYYNRDYFYYGRPSVWVSYRGRHSRYYHHAGFYTHRRPMWNGGLRGRDMHRPSAGSHRSGGNGYHVDFGGRRGGGAGMGSHGGGSHSGGNHSGAGYGGGNHSGNSHSGAGYGSGSHSGGSRGGMTSGRSGNYGGRNSGSMSHGNSFDRSSSRMSGGSRGSGMTRSGASYGSRGGGSRSSGGSRSGGPSRGGRR